MRTMRTCSPAGGRPVDPDGPEKPVDPAGHGCFRPGRGRGLGATLARQVNLLPHVLLHLGRGRRFRAKAPRHQPEASSACPLGQGPLPAPGGPVPGPGGLGNDGSDKGHPPGRSRGPPPVQEPQGRPPHLGPAVITSHPAIVAPCGSTRTGDLSSSAGDPIHYEINLVSSATRCDTRCDT
jgi:hypothetical protein